MTTVGARIAERGWRQGSILRDDDLRALSDRYSFDERCIADALGLVVSQSCDLTYDWLDGEPLAEILLGRRAENEEAARKRGNCSGGKHPRCLHMPIQHVDGEVWFEFVPWDRVAVDRTAFLDIAPDEQRFVHAIDLKIVTNWLAQRYIREAFPDRFNELLERVRNKQKKLHARLSPAVSGLYAQLNPDRDLLPEERYSLDLLALVPEASEGELTSVTKMIGQLAELIRSAGIEVFSAVALESQISYASVRSFRRFPLEHLSLRSDPSDPMPIEVSAGDRRGAS